MRLRRPAPAVGASLWPVARISEIYTTTAVYGSVPLCPSEPDGKQSKTPWGVADSYAVAEQSVRNRDPRPRTATDHAPVTGPPSSQAVTSRAVTDSAWTLR